MGIFDKLEQRLERGVNGAFARAFRSEVQPVEIASAMRRAMDDRAVDVGRGKRLIVPNLFVIELSTTDFEALVGEYEEELADDLIATASEHAESQRYQPGGPVSVQFTEDAELETGVFRLRPSTARQAAAIPKKMPPARAPEEQPAGAPVGVEPPHHAPQPAAAEPEQQPRQQRTDYRPSPAAPRRLKERPWLEIDGERYPLIGAITVIGRDDDADIVLDDPGISRHHSEIRVTYDGPHQIMTMRDLGSTNGTFVNGDRITSTHVRDGDRITVGRTKFVVHVGGTR